VDLLTDGCVKSKVGLTLVHTPFFMSTITNTNPLLVASLRKIKIISMIYFRILSVLCQIVLLYDALFFYKRCKMIRFNG